MILDLYSPCHCKDCRRLLFSTKTAHFGCLKTQGVENEFQSALSSPCKLQKANLWKRRRCAHAYYVFTLSEPEPFWGCRLVVCALKFSFFSTLLSCNCTQSWSVTASFLFALISIWCLTWLSSFASLKPKNLKPSY